MYVACVSALVSYTTHGLVLLPSPGHFVSVLVEVLQSCLVEKCRLHRKASLVTLSVDAFVAHDTHGGAVCTRYNIFGPSVAEAITAQYGIPHTFGLPIDAAIAAASNNQLPLPMCDTKGDVALLAPFQIPAA